jgi:class 3 adenylate cyclase
MAETDIAADGLERKLATILSADVAAYSRLMAEDEENTLQTFRGHKVVFEKLVQLHRGRIFNTAGDAILAEFSSAVEAVRCATEIQAALRTRNDQLPEQRRVEFRIGVNLGDVMVQGADLLGDGVNVAARLQAAAEPGGVCISGSVYDQILNKLSLAFKPLGEVNYKNIPQPVRTFAIAEAEGLGVLPSPTRQHQAAHGRRLWPLVAAILVLIAGGGAFWAHSRHQRTPAEYPLAAEVIVPQDASSDHRRSEKEARRLAKADRRTAEAEALAAPLAGEIKPQPGPSESATAAPTPPADPTGDDQSGLYRGQICYGATEALSAHCFKAQAVITRFKISGQWPAATGSTMYLAGGISRAGDVATICTRNGPTDRAGRSPICLANCMTDASTRPGVSSTVAALTELEQELAGAVLRLGAGEPPGLRRRRLFSLRPPKRSPTALGTERRGHGAKIGWNGGPARSSLSAARA